MNQTLIVYCHPYSQSFNHAVLEAVSTHIQDTSYHIIDLYNDNFNPAYDAEELRLFHAGKSHDPLVSKYLKLLRDCDQLILITPIWWNDIPAMLKGFIDKVMKEGPGLSHLVTKTGVKGLLTNIKQVYVLTTSTSPTLYYRLFCGDGIKRTFINGSLKQLGMKNIHWCNFGGITSSTVDKRKKHLQKIAKLID